MLTESTNCLAKKAFPLHIQDLWSWPDIKWFLMLNACVFTSVGFGNRFRLCVWGFDEFFPVGDCACGEVADGAIDEDGLFDALIRGEH